MPYAQPQDADQEFFTDILVTFVGNGAAAPTAVNVHAPPGVVVGWSATGNYTITLPSGYVSNATPIDWVATCSVQSALAADAVLMMRPVSAGTTVASGIFAFQTLSALTPTAADLSSSYTAKVVLKVKFATVLVQAS